MSNKHLGSSFDTFLEEEGLYSDVKTVAIKRVLTSQLHARMENSRTSKNEMGNECPPQNKN